MKKKYDLIFGMGGTCRCSMGLREAGLQYLSFPMDWHPGPGFVGKCETIATGFPHWLDRDALVLLNPEETENQLHYKNSRTGFRFLHDFHAKHTFDEQYPVICKKYERRIDRLLGLIERARKILVVWVNAYGDEIVNFDIACAGREVLLHRWPDKQIDILILNYREGLPHAQAESDERNGVRIVSFDYKDRSPGEDNWLADQHILAKWFKREYCIDEYRTPEEIAAWKKKKDSYEYDRWCAKNVFEWMRNKVEYKLYVHLRKKLKQRGVI